MSEEPGFVFLIGAARSGTKFIRDTVAASEHVVAIPYDVNPIWRRGNESFSHDELPVSAANEKIIRGIQRTLRKKALQLDPHASVVLEKTVSNSLRIPFVKRVFPRAKFVFLFRDGKSVVESSSRVWDQPTGTAYKLRKLAFLGLSDWSYFFWYAADRLRNRNSATTWGPRYEGISEDQETGTVEEICAKQWVACNEAMLRDQEEIPEGDRIEIRYEKLMADPGEWARLCRFLDLPDESAVVDRFEKTVQRDKNEKWKSAFDPGQQNRLGEIMNATLEKLEYETFGEPA